MRAIREMRIVEKVPDILIDFMIENAKKFKDIGNNEVSVVFASKAYDAIELHEGSNHPMLNELKTYL